MSTPDSHSQNRNVLEGILRKIPGFKGYLEKEYRRESDHLTRVWMADQLQQSKADLDNYMQSLVDQVQLDDLPAFERLRARIDKLISKMRGDVRGYSGFFDYVRVDEALLEKVYHHDQMLMQDVEVLTNSVHSTTASGQSPAQIASTLSSQVEALQSKYDHRAEMLLGVGKP
ncbi:MAG TPA: hypothetical protein DCY79_23495 [Planctomycetaceae bacterium]|nr:hypothetical protein [Blastopirellula sp.]HAY82785.1 hypothetical protein [Planctomycetaceae bacterium]